MLRIVREKVRIQPNGIIRLTSPELPAPGVEAEVTLTFDAPGPSTGPLPPLSSLIGSAKGCFSSAREIDTFLQGERDAWE